MGRVDLTGKLADTRARVAAESTEARSPAPFESLIRKEARVRDDQYTALTALARMLMSRRIRKAERITENTLIRVAIDLVLERADQLRGATETELRNSVSLGLRHPGSPTSRDAGPAELADLARPVLTETRTSGVRRFVPSGDPDSVSSRIEVT
ncbi:hypothetical protein [Microbacterium sp. T2.11-28]|uniref:hypothetical protein n=1 Tax=Microbacterium sp. T2.11-28 TaxID=3041169 RepID=UPI002477A643|nr:hypothetical protein [Microbacterium sp. T2.11-28]CAI9391488.1 hypothetical protein MICABA_01796 [Microbacterium sp. T2.11-28]